jgi:Flp pilus assembly protein protease CpaA
MEQYLPLGLQLGTVSVLALMCYQDWQARSISWPAFPLLGTLLLSLHLLREPAWLVIQQVAMNWGILVVLIAVLVLYVRLRFRGLRLWDCLGSGDVLYWAVAAIYFAPPGFLLYFLGSALAALVTAGLAQWQRLATAPQPFRIPLAGIQAACLGLLLGLRALAPAWTAPWAATDLLTVLAP